MPDMETVTSKFGNFTSFPLVTVPIVAAHSTTTSYRGAPDKQPEHRRRKLSLEKDSMRRQTEFHHDPTEREIVRLQSSILKERHMASEQRLRREQIPCLLPTNSFIAMTRKRDEDHAARSQLSFARAVARSTSAGMHELKMGMQPIVRLRYCEDDEKALKVTCI